MTKTIKEAIRENKIIIAIMIIIITILSTQMIFSKTKPEKTILRINLTEECNKICQTKGLTLSAIDRAGIGYTAQEISGRCICFNVSIINNS